MAQLIMPIMLSFQVMVPLVPMATDNPLSWQIHTVPNMILATSNLPLINPAISKCLPNLTDMASLQSLSAMLRCLLLHPLSTRPPIKNTSKFLRNSMRSSWLRQSHLHQWQWMCLHITSQQLTPKSLNTGALSPSNHLLFLTALNFSKISNVKRRHLRLIKRSQLIKLRLLKKRRTLSLSSKKLNITLNITKTHQAMKLHMSIMRGPSL